MDLLTKMRKYAKRHEPFRHFRVGYDTVSLIEEVPAGFGSDKERIFMGTYEDLEVHLDREETKENGD